MVYVKKPKQKGWHRWFAFKPVAVCQNGKGYLEGGSGFIDSSKPVTKVWLQFVLRRRRGENWYEYKRI